MKNEELLEKITWARRTTEFDTNRPISDKDWQTLLRVAQSAASSNGLEPWRILQIEDKELREKIAKVSPGMEKQLATAPKFIFFTAVKADKNYNKHLIRDIHGFDRKSYLVWQARFQALHQLLLNINYKTWLERQAAIPMGQMLLAASLMDIDCCPMEGFFYNKVGKTLSEAGGINLKKERLAVAVAFGYRLETPKHPKSRRPLSEIVKVV